MNAQEKSQGIERDHELELDILEFWTLFSKLVNSWRKLLEREMHNIALKPVELRILRLLRDEGEVSMNFIAEQVGVTSPWITTEINRLKKKGLVTKNRSRNDRRIVRIGLTEEGRKLADLGQRLLISIAKKNLEKLEHQDIDCLKVTLEKIELSLR